MVRGSPSASLRRAFTAARRRQVSRALSAALDRRMSALNITISLDKHSRAYLMRQRPSRTQREAIDRIYTTTWKKHRKIFERKWYALVKRRTGASGIGFALKRLGRWKYQITNVQDYAKHVHPSGRKRPIVQKEARTWVAAYQADVNAQIRKVMAAHIRHDLLTAAAGRAATRALR